MKKISLLLLLMVGMQCFAQQSVNDYKYVIVPEKFDFQNEANEYNMNNIVKMMFEKYGFVVYFPNTKMPDELALDRCKALYADITESGLIHTNMVIQLKDCRGTVVYMSESGRSKEKDRRKANYEALREASHSLDDLNYHYNGETATTERPVTKTESVTVYVPSATAASATVVNNDNLLTAAPTAYGYDLLDKANKVVLKMYKTTQTDYYSAKMETLTGVIFKKNDNWVFEYYNRDDKLVSEKLNIKF